jgi:NADH-quinone oxidoreductase subunit L
MTDLSQWSLLRWIPLLPLAAAVIHGLCLGLWRRRLPPLATILISCGSVGLSFLLSFVALLELTNLPPETRRLHDDLFTWIGTGSFSAEAALLLDPLSAVMILVVSGVGFLIHIYSIGYMAGDEREDAGFQRYFAYLNLFTFSMLVLVLADNLLLMFLGWEGVGLCSYLLVGFWYSDDWNAYCGSKAFIVNRLGDFGFLIGIFLLFWSLADAGRAVIAFEDIRAAFPAIAEQTVMLPGFLSWLPGAPEWRLATLIGLCFFLGAAGKSAQIPLYVWLPDAMAGPTPVSALIHAATMVTAGVYMVCRMGFLYAAAPGAQAVIAWVGVATALFAALIALAQSDIKKVLAYSTVSQLGLMFLAVGCGAFSAAMFHVVTHAFFKALLFLGAGAVILALHHEQDSDRMGGLARFLPTTHWSFLIGVLAIVGFPFTAGFFSKDEILLSARLTHLPGATWLYALALLSTALTALYMFRLYYRVFWGDCRVPRDRQSAIREPGLVVLAPLLVLAFLSFFGGWLGPAAALNPFPVDEANSNSLANFLAPALPEGTPHDIEAAQERGLAAWAMLVTALGFLVADLLYRRSPEHPARLRAALPWLHRLLEGRFYVDEGIDRALVRPTIGLSDRVLFRWIDQGLIDRVAVEGLASALRGLTLDMLRFAQSGLAQGYLFAMLLGSLALLGLLAW